MKFERLLELREERNLNQQVVAAYLHIGQSTYSDYENGVINVPIDSLMKLADFYDTSIDYLVGRTNERRFAPKE